jgi:hypothetical protein
MDDELRAGKASHRLAHCWEPAALERARAGRGYFIKVARFSRFSGLGI